MGQAATVEDLSPSFEAGRSVGNDFYTLGLAGCIDRLTAPLRHLGVSVAWETPHHGMEIPVAAAELIYQAAREILSNTFRHAGATSLTVRLAAVYHGIRLNVRDDGIGFNSIGTTGTGSGLGLMAEAVHSAGGSVTITSGHGSGTDVVITLPLD